MDLCSTAAPKRKRSWALLSGLPRKREAVRQFTPSWFTVTMGTGSVAITLGTFPYAFTGQQAIAWAIWWLTALLFVFFCIMLLGRALLFSSTLPHLFRHPNQSLFLGAVPMSVSTLTNGLVLFWIPRFGAAAGVAAHAMFWVNLPGVLGCILLVPLFMFTRHEHGLHTMSALWLLPVVPACVAANTAGVLASKMADSGHALVVFYLGVCLLGVGFMLSHQICTIYYSRLTFHSLPARELIISSFLPVGPMAMTAWALLNLGTAGGVQLEAYYSKHFDPTIDVQWLHDVAVPMAAAAAAGLGLFLWGYATWWLLLALASVGTCLRKGIPFNLGWWGAIFPMGVYTGATTQLGHAAHSNTFLVFGAIATCAHVVMWLVVIVLTAVNAWSGRLFHAPCLSQSGAVQQAAAAAAAAADGGTAAAAAQIELLRVKSGVEEQLQQPATPGDVLHKHGSGRHAGHHQHADVAAARPCCEDEEAAIGRNASSGFLV